MNKIKMNKRNIVEQIVESVVNKLLIKEGEEKPATTFENAQELLDQEYEPKEVFDKVEYINNDYDRVVLNGKENFIRYDDYDDIKIKILSDQWFDEVYKFKNGFGWVKLDDKVNFIDEDGKLISNQWFDWAFTFRNNGLAPVFLDGLCNFINTKGKIISNQWFDEANEKFNDGFVNVRLGDKWNYINEDGKLISKQWFDSAGDFDYGVAMVKLNGKWYAIDREANLTEYDILNK